MNYSSFPWIVSSGTLKTEDLLVSFWQTLESLHSKIPSSILSSLQRLAGEDSKEEDYKEEEALELLSSVVDLLDESSPFGFYFGSHPGDGALFGFWLSEDWESALEECDFFSEDSALCASVIEAAKDYGISSEHFVECFQGEVFAYSEEEAQIEAAKQLLPEREPISHFFGLLDFRKVWLHFFSSDFAVAKSSQFARYFLFKHSNA